MNNEELKSETDLFWNKASSGETLRLLSIAGKIWLRWFFNIFVNNGLFHLVTVKKK